MQPAHYVVDEVLTSQTALLGIFESWLRNIFKVVVVLTGVGADSGEVVASEPSTCHPLINAERTGCLADESLNKAPASFVIEDAKTPCGHFAWLGNRLDDSASGSVECP